MKDHPIIGKRYPDFVAEVLETGYYRFESSYGVDGLAKESARGLEILAVYANKPRTGQLRRFISACKKNFYKVYVWSIWSDIVENELLKQGFKYTTEPDWVQPGTTLEGMVYENENFEPPQY